MTKDFIPYEQALTLKELGFDEPCIARWIVTDIRDGGEVKLEIWNDEDTEYEVKSSTKAPLFQQAFTWFREKYFLFGQITIAEYELENNGFEYEIKSKDKSIDTWRGGYKTYEEAELECLKKLIEIVKEKK